MAKLKQQYLVAILIIFYSVGVVIHLIPETRNLALVLTEPQLFFINIFVIVWLVYLYPNRFFVSWLIIAFIFSVSMEIIGVKTGLVFGGYLYGDTMELKLYGVPLIIGLNWVILILAGYNLAGHLTHHTLRVLFTGLIVVLFDFIMEPVAMELDYWTWDEGKIPVQNYIAWFVITVILVSLLQLKKIYINNLFLKSYFIVQFMFFLLLRLLIL